jgi:hypothetical protein
MRQQIITNENVNGAKLEEINSLKTEITREQQTCDDV